MQPVVSDVSTSFWLSCNAIQKSLVSGARTLCSTVTQRNGRREMYAQRTTYQFKLTGSTRSRCERHQRRSTGTSRRFEEHDHLILRCPRRQTVLHQDRTGPSFSQSESLRPDNASSSRRPQHTTKTRCRTQSRRSDASLASSPSTGSARERHRRRRVWRTSHVGPHCQWATSKRSH